MLWNCWGSRTCKNICHPFISCTSNKKEAAGVLRVKIHVHHLIYYHCHEINVDYNSSSKWTKYFVMLIQNCTVIVSVRIKCRKYYFKREKYIYIITYSFNLVQWKVSLFLFISIIHGFPCVIKCNTWMNFHCKLITKVNFLYLHLRSVNGAFFLIKDEKEKNYKKHVEHCKTL